MDETGAARKAEAQLRTAVDRGVPAIAWVDQQLVGYGTCRARWPATPATR